jgi:hypothetical protein
MNIQTAIKILEKEQEFLGLGLLETLAFIRANPLAQPQKTLEAFEVFMGEGRKFFGTEA